MVPLMPVTATATAASDGRPPKRSAIGRAIGMVADLGASETTVSHEPPRAQAMPMAETRATTQPTTRATVIGSHRARMRWRCAYSGTARATVAGPTSRLSHCTPSR